jgi:hypothetical protein
VEKVDKKRKRRKKEKYFYPNSERERGRERLEISGSLNSIFSASYFRVFSLHQACSSLLS